MQLISIIIAIALALIVGIVTHFVTISNLKKDADSKIGNAESKAREIIDDVVFLLLAYFSLLHHSLIGHKIHKRNVLWHILLTVLT